MPLVFLHGVNTRVGDEYRRDVRNQEDLFARVALRGLANNAVVTHPYWGDLGASMAWGNASVPGGDYESFGSEDQLAVTLEESVLGWPEDDPLLAIARTDLGLLVDVLWTLVDRDSATGELAELGAKAISYAEANPSPSWLSGLNNDAQLLTELAIQVDGWDPADARLDAAEDSWESFGITDAWDSVREGASRLVGLPARSVGSLVVAAKRAQIHATLSLFIGDILVYLNERGTASNPGAIPRRVIEALDEANRARTTEDPNVVVVGHSMGGNILYDVLTHYRPDIEIFALITVGSQVGMFEEMKIFHESDPAIPAYPHDKVSKPRGVTHWLNVFDSQDILSFVTEGVFSGVEDFSYSTGTSAMGAHGSYFKRPSFHKRLNERLTVALRS